MHGDDEPYGSVQRVELFDQCPRRRRLTDDVEHHEPRRHRGRPLAGVAGGQPACCTAGRPRTPATSRSSTSSTTGSAATRRGSTPTTTASTTTPARRSWTPPGRRSPRRSCARCSGNLLGDLDDVRGLGGPSGRVLRRQGPPHAARRPGPRAASTCATAATGSLTACRASLWAAVHSAADDLATAVRRRIRRSG